MAATSSDASARARGKAASEECLKKGAKVEVNFDEPGFRGSWFTGTIIRSLSNKTNKILVEFDTLHDHRSRRLRENVDLIWVRPAPPSDTHPRSFQISDDVDAFHKDGWWEGVVTALHPPPSSSSSTAASSPSYSVFFRGTREEIQFQESDIRLHREWFYGKWVPPPLLESTSNTPPQP